MGDSVLRGLLDAGVDLAEADAVTFTKVISPNDTGAAAHAVGDAR